jgi:hypothetical protein
VDLGFQALYHQRMDITSPDGAPAFSPLAGVVATFMPRLTEFAFEPGLVAAVDQHAAAVCDTLADLSPTTLGSSAEPGSSADPMLAPLPAELPAGMSVAIPAQRTVSREDLSDYVLGFNDALAENRWREPVGYDFATLRLTAICWLVRDRDLLDD